MGKRPACVTPLNTKTQAIKLFLDNFQTALKQVKCETIYDHFLIELILEQHQKAKHAFELLNWWGQQRSFDWIYENMYKQATIEQSRLIPSVTVLSNSETRVRRLEIFERFIKLIEEEKFQLVHTKALYQQSKNDVLETMAPLLIGTLFYAAVLAVVYVAFHIVLPVTLGFAAIGAGLVALLSCSALFFYAIEEYLKRAITQIDTHNNFTKTYDYDPVSNQSETTRATSSITTELSNDGKKITISTLNCPLIFFKDRANNGSNAVFESITNCYVEGTL